MRQWIFCLMLIFLAACSPAPATEESRPTEAPSQEAPATIAPSDTPFTSEPSPTAMTVEDLPAIELLAGAAESCVNAEDYGRVLSFQVQYYELTTANRVYHRLEDAEGNILSEGDSSGENKNGEEAWGFYPLAYDLPGDSTLSLTIEVFESMDEGGIVTSSSTIRFNCTTGEVLETSFERTGQ